MTQQIVVVEDSADWRVEGMELPVVHVDDYLTGQEYLNQKSVQVINLCRGYKYLSVGYYCSLLAEARAHRVIPSVKSILDLSSKAMYSLDADHLHELVQRSLKRQAEGKGFKMDVFFGRCDYPELAELARQIFEKFPCPLLKVTFEHQGKWVIESIKPLSLAKLGRERQARFAESLVPYMKRRWRLPKSKASYLYDLAILHNPKEALPPSNERALKNFIKAGKSLGIDVELIEPKDYARLGEYDALFIRETTRIDHHTYRFAKKAESEGLVVIDDPQSILRCTNKVYLAELLRAHRVPTPKTVIVGRDDLAAAEEAIGYPMVLKVPDGSFSQGVFKVESPSQFRATVERLFKTSELILAQEYLYTEFDWRIGILNRTPVYASQYFMSKKHWQIVNYDEKGNPTQGAFKTLPVEEAPSSVVSVALRAANLVGNGLYGVDLKQTSRGVFVIEINDNPSIDAQVEDMVLKEELYRRVMSEFLRRLEERRVRETVTLATGERPLRVKEAGIR